MPEKPPEIKQFRVKEGEHEMDVFIPQSGDKSYDDYLEEAEREKTSDELRKKTPKPPQKISDKDMGAQLREYQEFKERKERGEIKRYY
ncbi:MAG: hypothetical protein NWE89_17445 [Candidatus Bathyarchaeota archaeon]|nr:hypothetical protein [Candidatus Bathyarchaeota archaeon]